MFQLRLIWSFLPSRSLLVAAVVVLTVVAWIATLRSLLIYLHLPHKVCCFLHTFLESSSQTAPGSSCYSSMHNLYPNLFAILGSPKYQLAQKLRRESFLFGIRKLRKVKRHS